MPMTGSAAAAYMAAWRARATPERASPIAALLYLRAMNETAGELDAGAFGFVTTEQALRALGLDLGELIAIDGELGIVGRSRAAIVRQQWARHRPHDGRRQHCKTDPQEHAVIQASPSGWNRARMRG